MDGLEEVMSNEGLTFDDVLLLPQYSEVLPAETQLETYVTKDIKINIPLLSAAMDTVTESKMAIALAQLGGLGVIHRGNPSEEQAEEVKKVKTYKGTFYANTLKDKEERLIVAAAVGVGSDSNTRIEKLIEAGVDILVVDTAHGHSKMVLDKVKEIKGKYKNIPVIAGNVATFEAARDLVKMGVDGVKIGVGPGSICTTRIVAGVGVPQLTAILDVSKALQGTGIPAIADGGVRYSGDITKAIAAGASAVMIGSLFAGTDESPGEVFGNDGLYKTYRGMGSLGVMSKNGGDRYFQKNHTDSKKIIPEGVEAKTEYMGAVANIVYQLLGGLRSGMGYCGAKTIKELQEKGRFTKITKAGLRESHPHDVIITKKPPNY